MIRELLLRKTDTKSEGKRTSDICRALIILDFPTAPKLSRFGIQTSDYIMRPLEYTVRLEGLTIKEPEIKKPRFKKNTQEKKGINLSFLVTRYWDFSPPPPPTLCNVEEENAHILVMRLHRREKRRAGEKENALRDENEGYGELAVWRSRGLTQPGCDACLRIRP